MDKSFDMDETHDIELTDSFVFDLREIAAQIRQEAEERTAESPDPLRDTTESRTYPAVKISWMQRLLGWFGRS